MIPDAAEQYWIWLSSVEGIGPKRFYQLIAQFEDARAVWDAALMGMTSALGAKTNAKLKAACSEGYFDSLFEKLERLGITPVARISENYPERLASIADPPPVLYVKGETDLNAERPFAIVGTRTPTRDGRRAAEEFAERLAVSGASVISGMARGVDTCAHRGALKGGGSTIAVLGCGVDVVYPPENTDLYENILASGGSVVSEYIPGTQPLSQNFPARNRIISGMSEGVLLVEGDMKSGGMITAGYAADQGRDLFAVPGSIYSPLSRAPNTLITQGAIPAICEWDIPEYYRWAARPGTSAKEKRTEIELTDEEKALVEPLRSQEMTANELAAETGIPISRVNPVLTMLELRGIIIKVPGGYRASV